jgi:hypothetical protein
VTDRGEGGYGPRGWADGGFGMDGRRRVGSGDGNDGGGDDGRGGGVRRAGRGAARDAVRDAGWRVICEIDEARTPPYVLGQAAEIDHR